MKGKVIIPINVRGRHPELKLLPFRHLSNHIHSRLGHSALRYTNQISKSIVGHLVPLSGIRLKPLFCFANMNDLIERLQKVTWSRPSTGTIRRTNYKINGTARQNG